MRTENLIAGTAILVLVPFLWGIIMAYGTEFAKRIVHRLRSNTHG